VRGSRNPQRERERERERDDDDEGERGERGRRERDRESLVRPQIHVPWPKRGGIRAATQNGGD
jgi:hypothetical protein